MFCLNDQKRAKYLISRPLVVFCKLLGNVLSKKKGTDFDVRLLIYTAERLVRLKQVSILFVVVSLFGNIYIYLRFI